WLGSIVSINCGDSLGVYQGRVSAVDQVSQTISLTRPFHNGVKCLVPEVTFRAGDITELKILEIPGPGDNQHFGEFHQTELGSSGIGFQVGINQNGMGKLVKKPASTSAPQNIPKRTDVKNQDVAISPQQQQCSKSYVDRHMESLSQSKSFRRSSSSRHPNQATPKKSGLKNGQMKNKDDECFGDDIEEIPDTDFDFEGNLALFDKAAVFEEIDTYERRSGTRSRGIPNERPTRYRHDENILESEPIVYRRITVPHSMSKEFCT
ncbi:Enhancer of mRNA-decapping protein 3, partial [Galemys pyrenaicus]